MQRNYKRFAVHSIQKFITYLSIIHVILFNPHTFGHGFLTQFTHFSAPVAQLSRAKTGATVATWVTERAFCGACVHHQGRYAYRCRHFQERFIDSVSRRSGCRITALTVSEPSAWYAQASISSTFALLFPRSTPTESSGDS